MRSKATDRYGRRVAELLRSGRNLNQELVGSGAASCTGSTSPAATGRPTAAWRRKHGCEAVGFGLCPEESPGPGISAGGNQRR